MIHLLGAPQVASGGGSEWITRVFMGAAALVGAFTAYRVSRRDSNADALRNAVIDLGNANRRIDNLEGDVLALRDYAFQLRQILADNGIASPGTPVLRSEQHS